MSLLIPEKLPDCIDKPLEKAVTPLAHNVGQTFGDLWYLVFGGITQAAEKKRLKYQYDLMEFENSCVQKIEKIPAERRVEPNLQVLCQALEDSKYCLEDGDVREMFASLIAATTDSKTYDIIHPSFSTILKQMSPQDAKLFASFANDPGKTICSIVLKTAQEEWYTDILRNVFFEGHDATMQEALTDTYSISSLERLGLLHISFSSRFLYESSYKKYENSSFFKECKKIYENDKNKLFIKEGIVEITNIGKGLLGICCPTEDKV